MRTFVMCLLVVGALAAESTRKNKHAKRGSLAGNHEPNVYNGEQFGQQLVRYTQPGHQRDAQTEPVSTYISDVGYHAGVLPLENQQQIYPTSAYDDSPGQILLGRVQQGYYDQSTDLQEQQVAQGINAYDGSSIGGQTIVTRVGSDFVNAPGSLPRSVPIARTIQVPLTLQAPVGVRSQGEVIFSSPEPFSYGQQGFVGQGRTLNANEGNSGGLEVQANVGSRLADYEYANVGSQQYDFGEQQAYKGVGGLENAFGNVYETVSYKQQVEQPAQVKTSLTDDQSSGYHYDKPAKKFTF